ncbi:MAG: riboflavin synthase [Candidatus Mariimomonas ferrooxydans]
MFTGLIESTGRIISLRKQGNGIKLTLRPESDMELKIGDSVSVNGVCLTAVKTEKDIAFEISPETMRSSNLGEMKANARVNLEQALSLTDRLGGHIVTGHVDGIGSIIDKKRIGEYTFYTFEASSEILKYTVKKGAIAVDGISLTVTGLDDRSFSAAIIPHTLAVTNIGDKGIGDKVNLEVDIIGKYVEKFMNRQNTDLKLMELLKKEGFTK